MTVHFIDLDNTVTIPKVPSKVYQEIGTDKYCIGYKIDGNDTVVHIYKDPGSGTWAQQTTFTIVDNVNLNYTPILPPDEPWRNNDRVGQMSLHVLGTKLVLLFQSMTDMQYGSEDNRWKLHVALFDTTTWTPTVRVIDNGAYTMLKSSGPMIFDSCRHGDDLFVCFNYGADERFEVNEESLARAVITETTQTITHIVTRNDSVKAIHLDYDIPGDQLFMSLIFDQKLVYMVYPNIDLVAYLMDLDEVRQVGRLTQHLQLEAHIGFTPTFPRRISIHNTYFIPVEEDAHGLSYQFYDNFIIFFYISGDNLRCVEFDFLEYSYRRGNALANLTADSYNIAKDDGVDTNYTYSSVFYSLTGFENLRFDAVLQSPVLELPTNNSIINTSIVDYVFYSPSESQKNHLHFLVSITRDGKTKVFDSEESNTNWFYNPSGDHRNWVQLPTTGLLDEYFGVPVKVTVNRNQLL